MKKSITIALAALMMLAASCKKNIVEKTNNENTNPTVAIEQSPDITRIIKFNNDVKLRRENPELKTREVITLDEAKDNIADLFNAVYGEPTEYYGETEHAEFTITLAVDDDGNVLLDDAVAAYEDAVVMARDNYHASTLENKGYICMSAIVGQQRGGTAEIRLNGVYGKKTEAPTDTEGDFDESLNWLYTYGAIPECDEYMDEGADCALERVMKRQLISNNTSVPTEYRAVAVRSKSHSFDGWNEPFWGLFIRTGEYADYTCIAGSDMNTYLEKGMYAVTTLVPEKLGISLTGGGDGPAFQYPYEVVGLEIQGREHNDPKRILHWYNVSYGQIQYVSQAQLQGPDDL